VQSKNAKALDEKYNGYVLYTAAQGMAYLHEKGVIHQDLKPANIMVEEPSNKAVICDLGVGKVKDTMTMVTRDGANAGTLAYQPLEQLLGKPPTASVDVYAFAVVALEVYSQAPTWEGHTYQEVTPSGRGTFQQSPTAKYLWMLKPWFRNASSQP